MRVLEMSDVEVVLFLFVFLGSRGQRQGGASWPMENYFQAEAFNLDKVLDEFEQNEGEQEGLWQIISVGLKLKTVFRQMLNDPIIQLQLMWTYLISHSIDK